MRASLAEAHTYAADKARDRLHDAARGLAQAGLSPDTIAAVMIDCCRTAVAAAVRYAEEWDAREAAELAADVEDEIDAKRERVV